MSQNEEGKAQYESLNKLDASIKLAPDTRKNYIYAVKHYCNFSKLTPDELVSHAKSGPSKFGFVESFHKTLKREYVWPREFGNYQEAEAAMAHAFTDYNTNRIHSSLGYLTPREFLAQWKVLNS